MDEYRGGTNLELLGKYFPRLPDNNEYAAGKMDGWPTKRARTNVQSTYQDSISLNNEYDIVYAREESTSLHSEPPAPTPQLDTDSWATTLSWSLPDDPSFALDPNGEWYDEVVESNAMDDAPPKASISKKKKVRSTVSVSSAHLPTKWNGYNSQRLKKRPHVTWMNVHRQSYLDEMTRWCSRGEFRTAQQCADCIARGIAVPSPAEYRCRECFQPDLTCRSCCLKRHRVHPFHRLEVRVFI